MERWKKISASPIPNMNTSQYRQQKGHIGLLISWAILGVGNNCGSSQIKTSLGECLVGCSVAGGLLIFNRLCLHSTGADTDRATRTSLPVLHGGNLSVLFQ